LFWRVFLVNAAVLVGGTVAAVYAPRPPHGDTALADLALVLVGLAAMLVANGLVLRQLFGPLERLAERMKTADVLRGGRRLPATGAGEVAMLERAYNEMLDRLERERREAGIGALRAQEAERERLARGLHDEVGQSMTAVLLQLKVLAGDARPDQRERLTRAQDVARRSLEDVGRLARQLRPELLDHVGLASALAHLATTTASNAGIRVETHLERDLPPLEPHVELAVYRVAQESLTNVVRHSGASKVTLSLAQDDGAVVLRVADDGRGLDPTQPEGGGLRGIRERALIVGGKAAVSAADGRGVEVRLEIPTASG
jgi:two-component system sensor histidine kinase UhpB